MQQGLRAPAAAPGTGKWGRGGVPDGGGGMEPRTGVGRQPVLEQYIS